jgi:hypothetical protein
MRNFFQNIITIHPGYFFLAGALIVGGYLLVDSYYQSYLENKYADEKRKMELRIETLQKEVNQEKGKAQVFEEEALKLSDEISLLKIERDSFLQSYLTAKNEIKKSTPAVKIEVVDDRIVTDRDVDTFEHLCERARIIDIPCSN